MVMNCVGEWRSLMIRYLNCYRWSNRLTPLSPFLWVHKPNKDDPNAAAPSHRRWETLQRRLLDHLGADPLKHRWRWKTPGAIAVIVGAAYYGSDRTVKWLSWSLLFVLWWLARDNHNRKCGMYPNKWSSMDHSKTTWRCGTSNCQYGIQAFVGYPPWIQPTIMAWCLGYRPPVRQ